MIRFTSFVFFFILAITGCCRGPCPYPQGEKPLVLVSIAPYQFFVEEIGGRHLRVQTIVPPGTDIHIFEPRPTQLAPLQKGVLWFRLGEPFEQPLIFLFRERIVDLREGIDLLPLQDHICSPQSEDRHIWLSPQRAKSQVARIAEALGQSFPEHREEFTSRAQALQNRLDILDKEIRESLDPLKERALLISHAALGYFCKDYKLTQLSIEHEGKDPGPKHLEYILQQARDQAPRVVIAMPQHNDKGARLLAERLNLPLETLDLYSFDYFETMRKLIHAIAPAPL